MNITILILSTYLFILPILYINNLFDKNEFPRLLFTYSMLLLTLVTYFIECVLIKRQKVILKITLPDLLVFLLTGIIFLSSILSTDVSTAVWGNYPRATQSLLFFSFSAIFYLVLRNILTEFKYLIQVLLFCYLGLLFNGLYGLYSYLNLVTATGNISVRAVSLEAHPIFFGLLMMIGFFISLTLIYVCPKNKYQQIFLHILNLIFILGILISLSRGIWVSSVLAILTFILIQLINYHFKFNKIKLSMTIKILIIAGIIFAGIFREGIFARVNELKDNSLSTSHSIRLLEIQDALRVINENSFPFGIGPSHLPFYYSEYRSNLHNQTSEWMNYPERIRNNYLDILAAFGPIGLTVIIIFIFLLLKKVHQLDFTDQHLLPKLFLYCGWIGLLIYGMFYFYTVTAWIYFWFLSAALILFGNFKNIITVTLNKAILITGLILSLLMLFFGTHFVYLTIQSELAFTEGLSLYSNLSYNKLLHQNLDFEENVLFTSYAFPADDKKILIAALNFFEQAIKKVPYRNSLYDRQYIHTVALLGRLMNDKKDQEKYYLDAYNQASDLIKDNPHDYLNFRLRASIATRLGMDKIAGTKYLTAAITDTEYLTKADPASHINFDNLGLLYREAGKYQEARQAFEKSIGLKPDYLGAYLHLAETVDILEGSKEAKKVYLKAAEALKDNKLESKIIMDKLKLLEK